MKIDLVFVTYNRLEYTRLALRSILGDSTEEFSLTMWDNCSTDGTTEYLKNEVSDPRIADIVFSRENVGQTAAVNEVWSKSKADLIGKLDNDCLVTAGWTRKLAEAHQDIDNLGVIACWHYPLDEFDEAAARKAGKIQKFGNQQILRHPWTCGTGLLVKRQTFTKLGPIKENATTQYWLRMALEGYINGYYYPLVPQEHMDDPRSSHCVLRDDKSLRKMREVTYVLREHNITTMKERWKRRAGILSNIHSDPWQAEYYVGWRAKLRRAKAKIRGVLKA